MRKTIYLLTICMAVCGCASTPTIETYAKRQLSFINYSATNYPLLPKEQPIDLFFQGSPTKPFDVIGEISGSISKDENIRPMLEAKTRQVGGNGIIDIQTSSGSVAGPIIFLGHMAVPTTQKAVGIKGKVIRYKEGSEKPL